MTTRSTHPRTAFRGGILGATLAAAIGGLPTAIAAASAPAWLQPAFDAGQTWANPAETKLTPANAAGLRLAVRQQPGRDYAGPTSQSDGALFVCTDSKGLEAIDLKTRRVRWSRLGDGGGHCNSSSLDAGTAYEAISRYDYGTSKYVNSLVALDRADGSVRWQVAGPADPALPDPSWLGFNEATLSDGALYVTNGRSLVSSYDAATGALRWQAATGLLNNAATVAGGFVFTTTWGGDVNAVFAHRAADGTLAWSQPLDASASEYPAASAGGRVFTGSDSGAVRAFQADSGTLLWQSQAAAGYVSAPLVATPTTVLVNAGTQSFLALDAVTGTTRWTATLASTDHVSSNLVLANDVLYFAATDKIGVQHLRALDARTGTLLTLAAAEPLQGPYSSLNVVGGRVFVTSTDGWLQVYALP
jgi:outer membrane protein assembly factor BamB